MHVRLTVTKTDSRCEKSFVSFVFFTPSPLETATNTAQKSGHPAFSVHDSSLREISNRKNCIGRSELYKICIGSKTRMCTFLLIMHNKICHVHKIEIFIIEASTTRLQ